MSWILSAVLGALGMFLLLHWRARAGRKVVEARAYERKLREAFRVSGEPLIGSSWWQMLMRRMLVEEGHSDAEVSRILNEIPWDTIRIEREVRRG